MGTNGRLIELLRRVDLARPPTTHRSGWDGGGSDFNLFGLDCGAKPAGFLHKPYQVDQFLEQVSAALAIAPGPGQAIGSDIPVPVIGDIIRHALDEIIASCMLLIGGEVWSCQWVRRADVWCPIKDRDVGLEDAASMAHANR